MSTQIKESDNIENGTKNNPITTPLEDQAKSDALDALQEDIIRNDTIPETSRTTPGSNGAFPVGAFDNSKDY